MGIYQLENADLFWNIPADFLCDEMGGELGYETAVTLGLKLTMFLRLLDC